MTDSTRRFTRRALLGGGAAAAVAAGAWALERHSPSAPGPTSTTSTTSTTSPLVTPPTPSDWSHLAQSLDGDLVLPSSPAYGDARLLYNAQFSGLRPQAIAYCASEDDVKRSLAFVREHGVALAARSGGHSYGGYSSCDGLVVDVSRMGAIAVTGPDSATIGAGAQLIDIYNVLGRAGVLLPGGSCPTVGVAGLAQGGGQGVFGRQFGLTCDRLTAARVVTADGRAIVADAQGHEDLWWALRGGGGGNFGVVTSFTFAVAPIPPLALFTLRFPWSGAAEVLEAWAHWMVGAPGELWSNCLLLRDGTAGYTAQVAGVVCASVAEASTQVDRLTSTLGVAPSSRFVGGDEYLRAMEVEAGCAGLSVAACHIHTERPAGVLDHTAYAAKSSYLTGPPSAARCAQLVSALEALADYSPYVGGGLAFDAMGGAVNAVAPDATAFVHRDALACIQASFSWSGANSSPAVAGGHQWLAFLGSSVFDPAAGAYQNYIDPTLADWPTAYYGANLPRLRAVKTAYDPDDLFHFAQSIRPA